MPNISSLKSSQSHHDSLPIPEDDPVPDYPVSQSEIMEEKPAETPDNIVEEPLRSSKQGRKEKRVKMAGVVSTSTQKNVSLLHILNELDDHFLKASESAHEVSKMLEVTRMHYHSNFAESQGEFLLCFLPNQWCGVQAFVSEISLFLVDRAYRSFCKTFESHYMEQVSHI